MDAVTCRQSANDSFPAHALLERGYGHAVTRVARVSAANALDSIRTEAAALSGVSNGDT
jgi:hypothetical protein